MFGDTKELGLPKGWIGALVLMVVVGRHLEVRFSWQVGSECPVPTPLFPE